MNYKEFAISGIRYDAAGRARIVLGSIDMGALEHDEIFGNGFESGD